MQRLAVSQSEITAVWRAELAGPRRTQDLLSAPYTSQMVIYSSIRPLHTTASLCFLPPAHEHQFQISFNIVVLEKRNYKPFCYGFRYIGTKCKTLIYGLQSVQNKGGHFFRDRDNAIFFFLFKGEVSNCNFSYFLSVVIVVTCLMKWNTDNTAQLLSKQTAIWLTMPLIC